MVNIWVLVGIRYIFATGFSTDFNIVINKNKNPMFGDLCNFWGFTELSHMYMAGTYRFWQFFSTLGGTPNKQIIFEEKAQLDTI